LKLNKERSKQTNTKERRAEKKEIFVYVDKISTEERNIEEKGYSYKERKRFK
jgi:hypothetical protein